MPLLSAERHVNYSEREMQNKVVELLGTGIMMSGEPYDLIEEFHNPDVGRISDIIVMYSERRVWNIECKLHDVKGVIKQAQDHLLWANYSLICMPSSTFIPNSDKLKMIREGIGLLLLDMDKNCLVEAIYPQWQSHKKGSINEINVRRILGKIELDGTKN